MPFHDPLLAQLRSTAQAQLEALRGRTVLVAVSGGADSVALLHLLLSIRPDLSLQVHSAHLDHGLRPESAREAEQVALLTDRLNVPHTCDSVDVRALATESHLSIEAAARKARYAFLAGAARATEAVLAVAHNQDDQAETVLLNLVRGAGISGLTGMDAVGVTPGAPDVPLIRPLLRIPSREIRDYCNRWSIAVIEDPSNRSLDYARNRIRHLVIPELVSINAQAVANIGRTAWALRRDEEALDTLASQLFALVATHRPQAVTLDRAQLVRAPQGIQVRLLRQALRAVGGTLEGVTESHLHALMDLVEGEEGRSLHLRHGVHALSGGGRVSLWRGELEDAALYPLPLLETETAPVQLSTGWKISVSPGECLLPQRGRGPLHEHVRLVEHLDLRRPLPEERFRPLGMQHEKRISDFLADNKVPRVVRNRVPLLSAAGKPVWLVGWRLDDRWKLQNPYDPFTCLVALPTEIEHNGPVPRATTVD